MKAIRIYEHGGYDKLIYDDFTLNFNIHVKREWEK